MEQRVEEKTREVEKAHQQMLQVEKMASLGKLAAVVAHEVNNPLTGIGTYAHLLRRKLSRTTDDASDPVSELTHETEQILKLIEEEAGRCGKIVRNLLLFSRTPGPALADTVLEVSPPTDLTGCSARMLDAVSSALAAADSSGAEH